MCPNKDVFSTYKSIEGRVILMGNGMSCKILGICTIKIKMHDGVLRTLTSVRHVPNLKNLISLGELDSIGCTAFVKNKSMRTFWGTWISLEARKVGSSSLGFVLGFHLWVWELTIVRIVDPIQVYNAQKQNEKIETTKNNHTRDNI